MRKIYHGNINKMATVAILMSDEIDFKTKILPEIKRNPSWRWNGKFITKIK